MCVQRGAFPTATLPSTRRRLNETAERTCFPRRRFYRYFCGACDGYSFLIDKLLVTWRNICLASQRAGSLRCLSGTRHLPAAEPTPNTRMPPQAPALGRHLKDGHVSDVAHDVAQDVAQDVA